MSRYLTHIDFLLAIMLSAFVVMFSIGIYSVNPVLRLITGSIFSLILPGYALISCFFPKQYDLEAVNRIALTFGFSTVVTAFIGYGLNFTSWKIDATSFSLCIASLVTICSLVGIYRRHRLAYEDQFILFSHSNFSIEVSFVILLTVGALGAGIAFIGAHPSQNSFTEFYVLGAGGLMNSYSTSLTPGESFTVTLGVVNRERTANTYRINGSIGTTQRVITLPMLEAGKEWEQQFELKAPNSTGQKEITFKLYKNQSDEPYRTLYLLATINSR